MVHYCWSTAIGVLILGGVGGWGGGGVMLRVIFLNAIFVCLCCLFFSCMSVSYVESKERLSMYC